MISTLSVALTCHLREQQLRDAIAEESRQQVQRLLHVCLNRLILTRERVIDQLGESLLIGRCQGGDCRKFRGGAAKAPREGSERVSIHSSPASGGLVHANGEENNVHFEHAACLADPVLAQLIPRRLKAEFGHLPSAFWWLFLGTLVNRAGTFIQPFFVLYLTGPRHVADGTAGVILTIWGTGALLSQPIGGVLSDRLGRRAALGIGLFGTAIVLVFLGLSRNLVLLTALAFVLGVVGDMYRPAALALVADVVSQRDQPRAFALQFWAINLGYSVATISAGVLVRHGYGLLFYLDAATTAIFGILIMRFVAETRPDGDHQSVRVLDPLRLLRSDRLLLGAFVLTLVYAVLYFQVLVGLPFAIRDAGLSPSVFGYVVAINGVLIVILQPMSIALLGRWPRTVTLPMGMALVGVGMAATGLCHEAWQFAVTVVVWTLGEIATAGSFQAIVAALAPEHMRGRYGGALGLAWGASGLLGPLLGAGSYSFSPTLTWLGCLMAGIIAGLGQRRVLSAIDRRRRVSSGHLLSCRPAVQDARAVRNSGQTLKPSARSCSRPSSVILSGPHGGFQTQLILRSLASGFGPPTKAAFACSSITSVSGQAADVRVMSTVTVASSAMSRPYTSPRSTTLMPSSGSTTSRKASSTSS